MRKRFLLLLVISLLIPLTGQAALIDTVRGQIILQVEDLGQAWYVNPADGLRYSLGRPDQAFSLMRDFGLGITNRDLNLIPIGYLPLSGEDSDGDGLSDLFEDSQGTSNISSDTDGDGYNDLEEITNGYSPLNSRPVKLVYDAGLINRVKGKILLQVESSGEAWYVHPTQGQRYFLGRPADAFNIMRELGLGISNANLNQLPRGIAYQTYTNQHFSLKYPGDWIAVNPALVKKVDRTELDKIFNKTGYTNFEEIEFYSDLGFIRAGIETNAQPAAELADKYSAKGIRFLYENIIINGYPAIQNGGLFPDYDNYRQVATVIQITADKLAVIVMGSTDRDYLEMKKLYDTILNTFINK